MKKRAFLITLIITVLVSGFFSFSACSAADPASDLVLSISINKSQMSIGDSIEVTLTVENRSSNGITMWDWQWGDLPNESLDRIAQTTLIPEGKGYSGSTVGGLGMRIMPLIPRFDHRWQRVRVDGYTTYTRTDIFTLDETLWWWDRFGLENSTAEYLIIEAYVGFYTARGQHNDFIILRDELRINFVR